MYVFIYLFVRAFTHEYILIYINHIRCVTIKQLFPSFSCTQSRELVRRDLLNLAPATFLSPRYASHGVSRANFNAQHAKRGVAA